MIGRTTLPVVMFALLTGAGAADPAMECDGASQVEIADCLAQTEASAERAMRTALGFVRDSAADLDDITGRAVAVPALEAAQLAWEGYRQGHCEFVGATFGGGSGTGIAIRSCRITLTRARTRALMAQVQ